MLVKNLIKKYGSNVVLNIEYLELDPKKIYGLVGPNGAGKTTLFKCMTNIVTKYDGQVIYEGNNVKEKPAILKDFSIVLDGLKVYENFTGQYNIEYFTKLRGCYDKAKIDEYAKKLRVDHALSSKVSRYSYGMKKKLLLLIAIITNPKFLILDEPFRGVDQMAVEEMKTILKEMNRNGMGIIISSHVIDDLNELCDEVLVLQDGRLVKNIDVLKTKESKHRLISTSDNQKFIEILNEFNYIHEVIKDEVKVDMAYEAWSDVYAKLNENGIVIETMEKAGTLQDNITEVIGKSNGGVR